MANFLRDIGDVFEGQRQGEDRRSLQAKEKQMQDMRAMEMQSYQQQMRQLQQQNAASQGSDKLMMDFFSNRGQVPQIPTPPQQQQASQPPMPGQASMPMQQPGMGGSEQQPQLPGPSGQGQLPPSAAAVQERPPQQQDSSDGLVQGLKQRAQMLQTITDPNERQSFITSVFGNIAAIPNPQQRQQLTQIWGDVAQKSSQQPPPYQSMGGSQQQQQQQQSTQIPDRPKLSMEEMANWATKQGVTNPQEFMSFLSKAQGFMSQEAKNELAYMAQNNKALMTELEGKRIVQADARLKQNDPLIQAKIEDTKNRSMPTLQQATIDGKPFTFNPKTGGYEPAKGVSEGAKVSRVGSGGVSSEGLSPEGLAVQEELIKAGRPVPKTRGGEVDARVLNSMGRSQEGGAGSGSIAGGQAEYKGSAIALTNITKDLAAIRPYKEMLDTNAEVAIELGKKISQSDSKLANKSINWIKQNAGDNPDTAEYLAQVLFVQTESARVLNNPRLVGQLTDSARHEMELIVNGDMPLNSTERVLRRIQKDGENRTKAMEKERDSLVKGFRTTKAEIASGEGIFPMPKSKDQLKPGNVYQTSRGPAKWNGTNFEAQ